MSRASEPVRLDELRQRRSRLDERGDDHTGDHVNDTDDVAPGVATPASPQRSWRRAGWIVAIVVLVATAAAAWWVGANTQSPDQAAARAAEPEASWVTAPVEFRMLSATLVARGDVHPETRTDVAVPASVVGDPVITQSVVAAGDVISEGDRVVEVSGRPVFVLQGDTPVYRTLQPAMTGDDVRALQESLIRLGFDVADDELGTFGASTKLAVAAFYDSNGYEPVPTSQTYPAEQAAAARAVGDADAAFIAARAALDNAATGPAASQIAAADESIAAANRTLEAAQANVVTDVALAQSALDIAKASRTAIHANPDVTGDEWNAANTAVSVAEIALSDAIRDTNAAVAAARAALDIARLARQELDATGDTAALQAGVDAATTAQRDAVAALDELNRVNGPTVPQGEVVFVTTTPSRVLSTTATLTGDGTGVSASGGAVSGVSLVSLASGALVVSASIDPDRAGLVNVGLAVSVLDELTDTTYRAEVSAVAETATTGADGRLSHDVIVTPVEDLPDTLAGANVRVTMTAASTGSEQLVVPLAAVSSAADGTTRVSILDEVTGEPVDVAVTAGLSADGFVAVEPISPAALSVKSHVIVGR